MRHLLKKTLVTLLFTIFIIGLPPSLCHGSLVIYYDDEDGSGHGIRFANMLVNLAGHFDPEIETRNIAKYAEGRMSEYDAAIYVGLQRHDLPEAFLEDVLSGQHRILWIAANFDQLAKHAGPDYRIGFRAIGWNPGDGYCLVEYKGKTLSRKSDCSFFHIQVTGSPKVFSHLASEDPERPRVPHFLCDGNVCYVAENPLPFQSEGRMFVFADLLHEFFQTDTPETRLAMVRFEDLAPGVCNVPRLRTLANGLADRGIPFSFGVVPVYKDPAGKYGPAGRTVRLKDDPAFVDALRHMQKQGGTLVMHGITHQHENGISREDWEFVRGTDKAPYACDSKQWARKRVLEGLAEFWALGFDPEIWETPHYAASHGDYRVFAEFFPAFYEKPLVFPVPLSDKPRFGEFLTPCNQIVPSYSPVSSLGAGLLPETLGYVDSKNPDATPQAILARAEEIAIVRDGVASFYFHHDMVSDEELYAVIDGLLAKGYTFAGPEHFLKGQSKAARKISSPFRKMAGYMRLLFMRLRDPDRTF